MAGFGNLDRNVEVNNSSGGGGVTLLPDDDYELEIIESDVKANTKGTGTNFDFKVQVASGPFKGEWFFAGITSIQHTSAQAQAIGQGQLRALCCAAGVDYETVSDTEELHYKPFFASVRSESYFSTKHNKQLTKNTVAKYLWDGMPDSEDAPPSPPPAKSEPTGGGAAGAAGGKPPAAAADTGASKPKKPWEK